MVLAKLPFFSKKKTKKNLTELGAQVGV